MQPRKLPQDVISVSASAYRKSYKAIDDESINQFSFI